MVIPFHNIETAGDDRMSTLQELVRYCSEGAHLGALLLTGEWGCGKTYLIEKELAEALRDTHFIVRVSLLGVDSVDAMNSAVRKQWLAVCTPFLSKMKQNKEKIKGNNLGNAINSVLQALHPVSGNVASAIVTADPLEYIPLEPEVEDHHNKGVKKTVVLVFDDLNRSKLGWEEIMGNINEYCENKGFKTIIIANEEAMKASPTLDTVTYKMLKEKTIERTVLYIPDYPEIIQGIVTQDKWSDSDPEYAAFLRDNQPTIRDVFASGPSSCSPGLRKNHNIRSLICALQEFHRVYAILKEKQVPNMDQYLYSFITCILISRNGVFKNGQPCYDVTEEDIRALYPRYSPDTLPESLRQWIDNGIWDEETVSKEISEQIGEIPQDDPEKE